MDKKKECIEYTLRWYRGDVLTTVEMDGGGSALEEQCIQIAVVELLRHFIDNPVPDGLKEGSMELMAWMELAYMKAMRHVDFCFTEEQIIAVKNLAFNYWTVGITRTQADPALAYRLIQCSRYWPGSEIVQ